MTLLVGDYSAAPFESLEKAWDVSRGMKPHQEMKVCFHHSQREHLAPLLLGYGGKKTCQELRDSLID
jgi:hypothetical protein